MKYLSKVGLKTKKVPILAKNSSSKSIEKIHCFSYWDSPLLNKTNHSVKNGMKKSNSKSIEKQKIHFAFTFTDDKVP